MKKIVLVFGLVMAFSLVSVASAATVAELQAQVQALMAQISAMGGTSAAVSSSVPTITKSLTVGSRGEEVEALQQYLADEGLLAVEPTGYFGAMTKKAVIEWQKANDVSPASGYFGPISRKALAALAAVAPATTGTGVAASGTPVAVGLDQADGSVNVGVSSIAPTTQTVKKGDTKDVYAIRFTATGGKVNVNRVDVHFSVEPWLVFNTVTLKDASGSVLATKTLNSSADVTTVTEGSEYYVRFEGLSTVVTPGTDTNLVVSVAVPANNSFVGQSGYTTVNVTVPTGAIRTVNGRGIYDSVGLSQTNVVTLTSTGNAADLSVTVAPTSPITGNQVYIAAAGGADTPAVPLTVYRVRSTNQLSNISKLVFTIQTDPALGANLSSSLKNFQLIDGTNKYYGTLGSDNKTVTFSLTSGYITVAQDSYKDLTLAADVVASSSSFAASTTMDISATVAKDGNYNTATYGGSTLSDITSDVTGGNLIFTNNAVTVTSAGPITATAINNGQSATVNYDASFTITLHNGSVADQYVSGALGDMFGTSSSPTGGDATTTIYQVLPSVANMNGDSGSSYYVIPAGGDRTFNVAAHLGKKNNTATYTTLSVTSVKYGKVPGTYTSSITSGLGNLTKTVSFSGNS